MKTITILGATGSIGRQTLDIVRMHPNHFEVLTLTAKSASDDFAKLCIEFNPKYALVESVEFEIELRSKLEDCNLRTRIFANFDQPELEPIFDADVTVTAISGSAGLNSTLRSIKTGKTVLIANKEPIVMLGSILRDEVRKHGTTIIPVDSEHNAIFQCSSTCTEKRYQCFQAIDGLRRVLLTGTGGPFLTRKLESLNDVTPEQTVAHPVWDMGLKISVDSATMMNKGLELIEARWLFDANINQIDIVIHPQGIVHSMVEYLDGSIVANLGQPDMRVPLAYGMFWPERQRSGANWLDLFNLPDLQFEPPDFNRFPCLKLAYEVAKSDCTAATVMNAANEVAVAAFLAGKIRFPDIATVVFRAVDMKSGKKTDTISQILEIDADARQNASESVKQLSQT